jgi:hypothetical protein
MNPARLIATGAAATLLLLSVACTTDHPAHPHFTHSPTPTPTPTPTDPQSRATALVHRYFDTYLAALRARDPAKLQAISGPNCVVCHQEIDFVTRLRDQNQRTDLNSVDVAKVDVMNSDPSPIAVTVDTNWPAYKVTDANNKVVDSGPAYAWQFTMSFTYSGDQMTVGNMLVLSRTPR